MDWDWDLVVNKWKIAFCPRFCLQKMLLLKTGIKSASLSAFGYFEVGQSLLYSMYYSLIANDLDIRCLIVLIADWSVTCQNNQVPGTRQPQGQERETCNACTFYIIIIMYVLFIIF